MTAKTKRSSIGTKHRMWKPQHNKFTKTFILVINLVKEHKYSLRCITIINFKRPTLAALKLIKNLHAGRIWRSIVYCNLMDKNTPPERIITGRFRAEKDKINLEDGDIYQLPVILKIDTAKYDS